MPLPQDILLFDIETGGFSPKQNPLLSISYGYGTGDIQTIYSQPRPGSIVSRWAHRFVLEPIKKKLGTGTEREAIERFTGVLEASKGKTLVGWNIGYSTRSGFDLPFLGGIAERYGLGERYRTALSQMNIRDIGREHAWQVAKEVSKSRYKEIVDPALQRQAVGYVKSGISHLGFNPARAVAIKGKRMAGWTQEGIYKLLGLGEYPAHTSEADVEALRKIFYSKEQLKGRRFVEKWNEITLEDRLIKAAKAGPKDPAERKDFYQVLKERGQKFGVTDWEKKLASEMDIVGGDLTAIKAGFGYKEPAGIVQGTLRGRIAASKVWQAGQSALPHMKRNWIFYSAMGALAIGDITKPLSLFSGKDDDYNIIEGLRHGGIAQHMRKETTDFGSGWVRRAISAGVSTQQISRAAKIAGREVIESGTGEVFAVGRQLGAGGFGEAYGAQSLVTGKGAVYKKAKDLEALAVTYTDPERGFMARAAVRVSNEFRSGQVAMKDWIDIVEKVIKPSNYAVKDAYKAGRYNNPLHYEAAMQKAMHQQYPELAPAMLGTTERGFFQEYGGRAVLPEEAVEASKFLKSIKEMTIARKLPIAHLDPHVSNMVKDPKSGSFKLIDFGVAAPMEYLEPKLSWIERLIGKKSDAVAENLNRLYGIAERITRETQKAKQVPRIKKAVEQTKAVRKRTTDNNSYDSDIKKAIRKLNQAEAQKNAQRAVATASIRGGKGHRTKTGSIVTHTRPLRSR